MNNSCSFSGLLMGEMFIYNNPFGSRLFIYAREKNENGMNCHLHQNHKLVPVFVSFKEYFCYPHMWYGCSSITDHNLALKLSIAILLILICSAYLLST